MKIIINDKELEFDPEQTASPVAKSVRTHMPEPCHQEQVESVGAFWVRGVQ